MEIFDNLRLRGFDYSTACIEYNPMETFVEYVSAKEVVHSRIIAELLDPYGSHHFGILFLQSFLGDFCPECNDVNMRDVRVTTERYISSNRRKIDIFIEWGNKAGAIIIENKLNEAQYQPNQLEDYGNSIKNEGYGKVYIICIHRDRKMITPGGQLVHKILYPMDIAQCFENALDNSKESQCITSYITLLKNIHKNNIIMENAKRLIELAPDALKKISQLVQAYNNIPQAKSEIVGNILRNKYPDIKIEFKKEYYLQIWNEEDYQRNGCWITICLWEDCYGLYITTFQDDQRGVEKIEMAEYTNRELGRGWVWYSSQDDKKRFLLNNQLDDVIVEVERLLNILSKK